MKKIEMEIECPSCKGTGVYVGMAERGGASVVCNTCKGSGKKLYCYSYNDFTGRKITENVKRVYKQSCGYVITPDKMVFDKIGEIDMSVKGVSYQEFIDGKIPDDIEELGCPMITDQGACHDIKGFTNECNNLNGGWVGVLKTCKNQCNKKECWERFHKGE